MSIGGLAQYVNGRAFKPTEWKDKGRPIIRIQNLNNPDAPYNFSPETHEGRYLVKQGDLLFAWSASLGAHIWKGPEAWLNQHIFRVVPEPWVDKTFFYYLLTRITGELYAKAHGSGMVHVTKGKFEETAVLLPPLNEQRRITAKIEELLSELDKGIESLKTARAQLKVYRQAVLKHAFEGKLTARWREQNKDKLESPEQLLPRINTERNKNYQKQLKAWEAAVEAWEANRCNGAKPTKPLKPKSLAKLTRSDLQGLGELPDGWGWAKIGEIASVGTGVTPLKSNQRYYAGGSVAWVTSGALNDPFVREPSDYVTPQALNETNLRLYPPHTLVVALYGEGKTRGKCSELLIEATTNQAIAAIGQEGTSAGLRNLLKWFLTKNYEAMRLGASGGVQPNLNLGIIENMAVPICSLPEAAELSAALEAKFSTIERLDAELLWQIQRSETLRQSILKRAFSGLLVPQDTNDEPASALLERIRAEKAAQGKAGKTASRPKLRRKEAV